MSFLNDIVAHLNAYASTNQVNPAQVHVRLTFADGSGIWVRGLEVADAPTPNGWGMIVTSVSAQTQALVIREAHVIKAEFQLTPADREQIGFHTEASP